MERKSWFCQDCRVLMLYSKEYDCHICPRCKTRVYPHDEKDQYINDEIYRLMKDLAPTHLPREIIPGGGSSGHGSGSKSKGRSRKSEMKKPTVAQLNRGLNGLSSDFNG